MDHVQEQDAPRPRKPRTFIAPSLPGYITEHEKAALFGQSYRSAIRDRVLGNAPCYVKQGVKVLYRLEAIKKFLLDKEVDPSKPAKLTRRSRKVGS
jgi:hypothetical protein